MSRAEKGAKPQATWLEFLVRVALVGYWIAIFAATHLPIRSTPDVPGGDKTLHFTGYGILAALFGMFLVVRCERSRQDADSTQRRIPFAGALIVLASYAAFDELTQLLVARHADIFDWLADLGGIVIGLSFAAVFDWIRWAARHRHQRLF